VPTVEPWSTMFELVPTVAVPLPEPLAVKYAQPPTAAMAAISSEARTAIRLFVKNVMFAALGRVMGLESSSTLNVVAAAHEGMPHSGIQRSLCRGESDRGVQVMRPLSNPI